MAQSDLTQSFFAQLDNPLCIDIEGADAARVLNNLCTNDISRLAVGASCEAFVTDIRGWVVAHVVCLKTESGVRIVGQHTDSAAVCNHIDRYIVREDAAIHDRSQETQLIAVDCIAKLGFEAASESGAAPHVLEIVGGKSAVILPARMTGAGSGIVVAETRAEASVLEVLQNAGLVKNTAAGHQLARIRNFWPLFGTDILAKALPQELDRDAVAISFTKGCYLGQETIARLDARGQLQKKLCLVQVADVAAVGGQLMREDKEVGSLLSAAHDAQTNTTLGLAMLRRGNFEPGQELKYGSATASVLAQP